MNISTNGINRIKKRIFDLIAENKIPKAIMEAREWMLQNDAHSELLFEITIICANYKCLFQFFNQELIEHSEFQLYRNKLLNRLLQLIEELFENRNE